MRPTASFTTDRATSAHAPPSLGAVPGLEDVWVDAGTHRVRLSGEWDLAATPRLARRLSELIEMGKRRILLDLSDVAFVDLTLLGLLLRTHRRLGEDGGRLEVVCPREDIRRAFRSCELDDVLELHASDRTALAALAA